jgi:hypothetical protein|tara:strand:- start:9705 stop:10034 length:330 start_codon:yes stop_codon:yes gene_type:complete
MARGSYMKLIKQWIEEIPDSKLEGGIPDGDTVHKDKYMRLDNQRTITKPDGSMYFNLQVQVNYGCPHTTLVKLAPDSVAMCLAPVKNPWSAARIKKELLASITGTVLGR